MFRDTASLAIGTVLVFVGAFDVGWAKDLNSGLPLAQPAHRTKAAGQRSSLDLLPVMPSKKIRETIVAGAQQLKGELAPFEEGATWCDYLKLDVLLRLASNRMPSSLDAEGRRQIQGILVIYDAVAKNAAQRGVSGLGGFRIIHAGLVALINPTYANDRDRLIQSTYLLSQAVTEMGMGASWKRMLAMPKDLVTPDLLSGKNLDRAIVQLRHMQTRFDLVEGDSNCQAVVEIPIFKITQANLEKYLGRLVKIAAISD